MLTSWQCSIEIVRTAAAIVLLGGENEPGDEREPERDLTH